MTIKKSWVLLFLFVLLIPMFLTETAYSSASPLLFINPYRVTHIQEADLNLYFSITIEISDLAGPADGGESLYGWGLTLSWDTTNLEYISATEGEFLQRGGYGTFWVTPTVDEAAGTALLACTRTGDVPGEVGGGILVHVRFRVDNPAVTDLTMSEVKLRNNLGRPLDPNTGDPDYYFTNLQHGRYGPPIPEDVYIPTNTAYEAIIDVFDLATVAIKFGEGPGYTGPEDVNGDGNVDIDDLIAVSLKWGYYF